MTLNVLTVHIKGCPRRLLTSGTWTEQATDIFRRNARACKEIRGSWEVYNILMASRRAASDGLRLDEISCLNRRPSTTSWSEALAARGDPEARRALGWLTNTERANWRLLVPLPPSATVLELGAGLGTMAQGLALYFRRVVAVEPSQERVTFMWRRFADDGIAHVTVVQADLGALPVRPSSVDLVAITSALNWSLAGTPSPREYRLGLLEAARDALRPGGFLYLGVVNPLMAIIRRRGGGSGGSTIGGYCRLLERAGYEDISVWGAEPSHEDPRYLVPWERSAFNHYLRVLAPATGTTFKRAVRRALNRIGALKYSFPSWCVLARRGA